MADGIEKFMDGFSFLSTPVSLFPIRSDFYNFSAISKYNGYHFRISQQHSTMAERALRVTQPHFEFIRFFNAMLKKNCLHLAPTTQIYSISLPLMEVHLVRLSLSICHFLYAFAYGAVEHILNCHLPGRNHHHI